MSQRDHDLMEPVTAAEAISVPASPPPRDSMEDADPSLTRKRPRLDSGSKEIPTMPTDPAPTSTTTAPPHEQLVEMTIRSQPPSSSHPLDSADEADYVSVPADPPHELDSDDAVASTEGELVPEDDAPPDSPPVIAIEDDEDDEDGEAIGGYTDAVQFAYDADSFFQRFPFTQHGNYMQALQSVAQHFQGQSLDGTVLPQIAVWLESLPTHPSHWKSFFLDKSVFWDEFSAMVFRVLARRSPFGDQFCDDGQSEDEIFTAFFGSYLRICARLLQVDAEMLSQWKSGEAYIYSVVSYKHIRIIYQLLRLEKSNVFVLLSKEYGADTHEMGIRLLRGFIQVDGLKNLFNFADQACGKVPTIMQNFIATWTTQLSNTIGWHLSDVRDVLDHSQYCQNVLQYFRRYNADLQVPSKVTDTAVTRDIITHLSNLLRDLCLWDESLAAELVEELLDFDDPESPTTPTLQEDNTTATARDTYRQDATVFPTLVMNAWRFKLLRKYVVKGRMELRVMSIGFMDNALVDIWKEYNGQEQSINHPVMQYLADFLLHERVIDYIISVDSHPQLISRSGNIVGFLVVTNRYSENQTDAIWNTVSNSSDPRVVSATMTMLRSIFGLMHNPELVYLCAKLHGLPIESYNIDILRFLRELTAKLQPKYVDWSAHPEARPWNVCIRVLQDTSPCKDSSKLFQALHQEACEQLRVISPFVTPDERHEIYRQCVIHIASRSPKATGSVRAIWILACNTAAFSDSGFFQDNPDVIRQVLEETCAFVKEEHHIAVSPLQVVALEYRLDMLSLLICRASEMIPIDLYQDIWDHLVGKHAQSNFLRDMAWSKFMDAVTQQPDNEFCKQLISTYIPKLGSQYYTPGMYNFVAAYRFPTTRRIVATPEGEKQLLQVRGADLLWSIVLSAPPQSIEDLTTRLLVARYLELDIDNGVALEEVEAAHVAVVDRSMQELLSAYKVLRSKPTQDGDDQMDVALSESMRQQNERRFTRTIVFLKLLLMSIRTKPEFNHTRRSDSKIEPLDIELPYGDAVEIKYQSPITTEKQSILIGMENTLTDLHSRLCQATGISKLNIFARGQRLNLADKGNQTIADLDLAGQHLLLQKAPGSEVNQPLSDTSGSCSVFEAAVVNQFEEFFACMDGSDPISGVLYEFLVCFPYRERIAESVLSGTSSANDLFPPGKLFQAKYAAFALQWKLKEQVRRNTLDDKYLANAVRLLDHALLNSALLSESFSSPPELHLAGVLVQILMDFLKALERPPPEVSTTYFSDESRLVDRLLSLISVALKADSDGIVYHSYATIVEASLHSRGIWEAFTSNVNVIDIHKSVLLTNPRKGLREPIARVISSVCGGALPPSSALTEADTAASFWSIISSILPDAVQFAEHSEQLFDVADQVFRKYDENHRDEASLRSYLSAWSSLLLSYTHEERVGRDETDFVVLGFTKLLLSCIPSLKSFKKPLNSGSLVERIWYKFLFVPKIVDLEEQETSAQLPVLESKTRKELYDLVLALAEDRTSYNKLLELAKHLHIDESNMALQGFSIDRANEIRSSTGYVGLYNPRAICYMNSLLTQLFMNVNFRKFLLSLHVAEPTASQSLLHETQKLFASMQNSYRKSANPLRFAGCVKGTEGLSIDINVQMDADEFYNLLFDQWEAQMLSPEIRQQFRSFYGGQTVNQIKSKECEHVSERVESFFVVQCDVQGKSTLNESLQSFVEGDVMEGDNKWKCESCGKLRDAVKRTCLKEVPDNLIFHLKRFDFDLVEMRRAKINDHFEFPSCIDISPFKIDHLSDPSKPSQEDTFELVGVLVHQGTSENGHYYSYIRERPCPSGSPTQWVEFNDRDVDAFDHLSIPYHTFGGFYDEQFQRQQKQFSAYMLFYQRRSAVQKDYDEYISSPLSGIAKVTVPPTREKEVQDDNENFIREYSLYDPHHSKFVRQVLTNLRMINRGTCSEDHQQESQALHIVLEHLCQTLFRVRTAESFDETLLQLRKTVLSCPTCCLVSLRWLATQEYALLNMLLQCTHMKIRSQTRAFLIDSLRYLRNEDPSAYGTDGMETDSETGPFVPADGILIEIVQRLRMVVEESYVAARGWDDLYLTLCQLSQMGHVETAVLLNEGFLDFCLRVFSMHATPALQIREPDIWRLVEKKKRVYNRMIEFVHTLLSNVDPHLPVIQDARHTDRLENYDRNSSKFPLSRDERHWLHFWHDENRALAALDKMLEQFDTTKTDVFYPGEILKWMLQTKDSRIQQLLHCTIYEGILQLQPPFSDPYVRAALPYCEASPEPSCVEQIIEAVSKSATKLRDQGGVVHIQFFAGLLHAENETVFEERSPDPFYNYSLIAARKYSIPLLLYDDDGVRKATSTHLQDLFTKYKNDELATEDTLRLKYKTVRSLTGEMCAKIAEEHQNSTSRSYMQPMIQVCQTLLRLLYMLQHSDEPTLEQFKNVNDATNLQSWHYDLEARLRHWTLDEGTPISVGEGYEQSDYGSESDVEADMLEM